MEDEVSNNNANNVPVTGQIWRNVKHGQHYIILNGGVKNTTDKDDGKNMILYRKKKDDSPEPMLFIREESEFVQKFEPLNH